MFVFANLYKKQGNLDQCKASAYHIISYHIIAVMIYSYDMSDDALLLRTHLSEHLIVCIRFVVDQFRFFCISLCARVCVCVYVCVCVCQAFCSKIISADPSQEGAAVLLSDLLFTAEDDGAAAVLPLQHLLKAAPANYIALEKMILMLRRSGKLEEVSMTLPSTRMYASCVNC